MKLLHCADLHLGKRLGCFDLLPDQRIILQEILSIAADAKIQAILLAGDVYDKPDPPAAAMAVFSDFAARLHEAGIALYLISGNHDSSRRLSYFSPLLAHCQVYSAGEFTGAARCYTLRDAYGPVVLHLLPFLRPATVRRFFPSQTIGTYEDAVRAALAATPRVPEARHVLLCHQFITGAATCDSEQGAVGGLDQVPAEVFAGFDYVALGHLHGPQQVGSPTVRYSGSPLPYSFSECGQKKSVTVVDLGPKGQVDVQTVPLHPPHPMREIRGSLEALRRAPYSEDFVRVILTDEEVRSDARVALLPVFPNMLRFGVENSKTATDIAVQGVRQLERQTPLDLFQAFYAAQNGGVAPGEARTALVAKILRELEETE